MASLDYELEKSKFLHYYESSRDGLEAARVALMTLIRLLLASDMAVAGVKVEGRLKDRDECLSKFRRKYQTHLESAKTPYTIFDHISDLIGIRIVCFYEDEVERVRNLIMDEFEVIDITDKTAEIEVSDNSFGYKGLHMDLKLTSNRRSMREYASYAMFSFELQIRTVIQDSWSVLDHKIQYKKSIPNHLRRRINTLAALFDLADREFRAIRDGTDAAIAGTEAYDKIEVETTSAEPDPVPSRPRITTTLDAFSLLRIAKHFFHNEDFESYKVDGFTLEVLTLDPHLSRGKFNFYLREKIGEVRRYKGEFENRLEGNTMNAFTMMRHCLYAGDPAKFASIVTDRARESFDRWRRMTAILST